MERPLTISASPHIRSEEDVRSIMLDVIIALMPSLGVASYLFGFRAFLVIIISVTSCIAFEFLWQKLLRQPVRIHDLSCVVTGILLAFCLPVTVPYYVVVTGAAFAILLCKQLYGGIGKNFINPALAARVFLALAYPKEMTSFVSPLLPNPMRVFGLGTDVVTAATPLVAMKKGLLPTEKLSDLFLGNVAGALGETSAFLLIMGGLYLVFRGVIKIRIPVSFLATVALLTFLFPRGALSGLSWMEYSMISGGLMLGAIFMATDYSTSPTLAASQIIYGAGCGALTVLIRYFGSYPEGVSFAILIMNCFTPLLDAAIRPRRFGVLRFSSFRERFLK